MNATQDLIAAALRLTALAERNTDDRDEWQHSIREVREMCARAMVQPAAPDMAEVERLVDAFSAACNPVTGGLRHITKFKPLGQHIVESQAARTTLLDYVRGVLAERDALIADNERLMQIAAQEVSKCVPVGWSLVPIEPTREMLDAYVKNGARFNSARSDWAAMLAAAPQPISTADVPMPEPIGFIDSNDSETWATLTHNAHELAALRISSTVFHVSQMRTYGDAREAAGYAAGLRELLDCRTCRNYTRHSCIQTAQCVDGDGYRRAAPVRFWSAVLRGEVKP